MYTFPSHCNIPIVSLYFVKCTGSSTNQADGDDSEVILKPVKIVPDPFRLGDNLLCLCETINAKTGEPLETNKRAQAAATFSTKEVESEEPWYGIEQEYTLFDPSGRTPLGWPQNGFPAPQVWSPYSTGVSIDHHPIDPIDHILALSFYEHFHIDIELFELLTLSNPRSHTHSNFENLRIAVNRFI